MLGIGIDWAEEFHDVAFGTQEKGVIEQFRIQHGPAGVTALIERALVLEPDPAEIRVVLETRHGLLVEALLDAGFTVLPVNPDVVARRRGPARKKDDAEDARICCLLALDRHASLKVLVPHGEIGGELRAIGRDDDRAARDQRRLLNRLRADHERAGRSTRNGPSLPPTRTGFAGGSASVTHGRRRAVTLIRVIRMRCALCWTVTARPCRRSSAESVNDLTRSQHLPAI